MKIHELDLIAVEMPGSETLAPLRRVLIRLGTKSGAEGWGETSLPWPPEELPARRDALLTALEGQAAWEVEELHRNPALVGSPLRAGIEMACWDLLGRAAGQPLCHLMGGCFRGRVPIAVGLEAKHPEQLARKADEASQEGLLAVTLQLGGDADADLAAIRTAREAIGPRTALRLDGGEHYDMETARDLCSELEFESVSCLIDPLNTRQLHALASLGRQTGVPMAACRIINRPADALAAVRCGAAAILILDMENLGGLLPTRKALAIAEAAEVSVALAVGPSVGIATAAMLQLAAASPPLDHPNQCSHPRLTENLLVEPLEAVDGMLEVPQATGLGVRIDRGRLERYVLA